MIRITYCNDNNEHDDYYDDVMLYRLSSKARASIDKFREEAVGVTIVIIVGVGGCHH